MKEPREKGAINKEIRIIGKRQDTFTRDDCRDAYLGEHYIGDWQECLERLVAKGKIRLVKVGSDPHGPFPGGDKIYALVK